LPITGTGIYYLAIIYSVGRVVTKVAILAVEAGKVGEAYAAKTDGVLSGCIALDCLESIMETRIT